MLPERLGFSAGKMTTPKLEEADLFEGRECGCVHGENVPGTVVKEKLEAIAEPVRKAAENGKRFEMRAGSFFGLYNVVEVDGDREYVVLRNVTAKPAEQAIRRLQAGRDPNEAEESVAAAAVPNSPANTRPPDEAQERGLGPTCPEIRLVRDPHRFPECMKKAKELGKMDDSGKLWAVVKDDVLKSDQEMFIVIHMDTQLQVRGISIVGIGSRDSVQAPIPDILRHVIAEGSSAFAVCHVHPSTDPAPSEADLELTKAIEKAAEAIDILFMDHIIAGGVSYNGKKPYYSFLDAGKLKKV
jgi:hypothetical protein